MKRQGRFAPQTLICWHAASPSDDIAMKRKRHHRTASEGPGIENAEDEGEDRLEQLLEAAAGAAMPQDGDSKQEDGDGDGDGGPDARCHEHSDHPVSDFMAERLAVAVEADMAIGDADTVEDFVLTDMVPNMRRCGLCGGTTDGEPAADTSSEAPVGQTNGSLKLQDESLLADVTIDTKKSDGFGTETGWLGRLLGPLGEQFGVGGVWIHENCAIWSPEVYFSGFGRLKNVKAALRRGRLLRCSLCNQPGATIGCRVDRCPQNYHLPCARAEGCMFNHRKYLMACYDHSYLFKRRKKKRYWFSKSLAAHHGETHTEHSNAPRISKAQRRAAAAAARYKDIEAEERYLDKSGEDEEFVRRERKRLHRDLAQIAPVKLGGGTPAHNQGIASVGWDSVAGLQDVVQCLKEMVTLPLLYPEVFTRLGISAPRGVLLHGHPGTGKTLVVRALAGACSRGGQQVSYFARKGADILGKYVGDSERQLRLLFQVAEQCQPAIIFFDEIDGLAPSRCGDRDQTQSSVVSTLLALMDGLSSRGSVVVIGATNRPDSLDPALRRPGRFDREIYFPLPSTEDRGSILRLHTRTWSPAPSPEILAAVSKATPGFAGADLQALCVEAAMTALRRVVPLKYILDSAALEGTLETKLPSLPSIQVKAKDWAKAVARAPLPCSRRLASTSLTQTPSAPLPRHLAPALLPILVEVLVKLGLDARVVLPPLLAKAFSLVQLALKAASNLRNTDKDLFKRDVHLPESWHTMVLNCFKETPSSLAKAMENAFLDTGIMVDTYGVPGPSQPASSVRFGNNGTGANKSRIGFTNSKEPSGNDVRIPTCMRKILSDDNLDKTDFAAEQKWPGCKFRILLFGGAQQGQKFVASAFINGFEGLAQTRTLSLPAMLMEGGGEIEEGLIYIIGEARRSGPCLLYMPKIEDWVVSKIHNGESNNNCIVERPEGFGLSNADTHDYLREVSSETNIKSADEASLDVSVAWKLMKQQLQTMPPDTQIMLLATCESGVESLPREVVNYFSPQPETASRNSSLYPAKVSPCVLVEFTSCHDPENLLERASQDIARALAAGFGSRIARLREEYNAGCSAEKPKLCTAAGSKIPTSVQHIIAEKVSQIRTRVREDLGRDLRNIGQDWARNLGGSPYANDVAKVFGIDVGRGLGLDLSLEFRNLESGLIEEVNKDCSIDVEDSVIGGIEKRDFGASCSIRGQSNEQNVIKASEQAPQRSSQGKATRFVISGARSLDFNEADLTESDVMRKTLNARDVCATADLTKDIQNHQPSRDVEQFEGQPTLELFDTTEDGVTKQAVCDESATCTAQRKTLQSAIAFCGYRFLRDPQLAGLRNATTMLKRVPVVDIHDCNDAETFNWETLEYQTSSGRRKDEVPEPEYVRGLTAVGFKAYRGVYRTGRELEYEFRRVIETLYERVQQKIDSGKDGLQYFHLTTQAATLVDLMASWVLEVRKLEMAANMHNLPIAKCILEDEYIEEELQESDQKDGDESTHVGDGTGEHHSRSTEEPLSKSGEGATEQVENGCMLEHNSESNYASHDNGDAHRLEVNGLTSVAFQKDGFSDDMPTTPNVRECQPVANGIARGALGCFLGENSRVNPVPAKTKGRSPYRNGRSEEETPVVETIVERSLQSEKNKLLSSVIDRTTPEPSRQQEAAVRVENLVEDSTSVSPALRSKSLRQAVRFKPECIHQLESVVRKFLDLSCKADISNFSVEVLHDQITGCASTALAASHNVLSKSEKTNITHQVILQWAGLTCHCGGDKAVEAEFDAKDMGGTLRQLAVNGSPTLPIDGAAPIGQLSWKKFKKRKRSRLSRLDNEAAQARRLSISAPETSRALTVGLVSPMKQTDSKKSYTCLRPVIRAVKIMVDDLSRIKESSRKFAK